MIKCKTSFKFLAICLALLLVFTCSGCKAKPKTFTKLEMTIELTNDFYEKQHISYTTYYESKDELVVCLREPFTLIPDSKYWSITEYANACIRANSLTGITPTMSENDKYAYFKFDRSLNGQNYTYLAACFKAEEAFWLIQFATYAHEYSKHENDFFKYADSVFFS